MITKFISYTTPRTLERDYLGIFMPILKLYKSLTTLRRNIFKIQKIIYSFYREYEDLLHCLDQSVT